MNKNLLKKIAVTENETILNCLKVINSTHKQFVFIKNKKEKLLGILTDADIRRALLKKKKLNETIKDIYNKNPKFVFEDDDRTKVRNLFKKTKVNFLLVVNKSLRVVDFIDIHSLQQNDVKSFLNTVIIMAGGKGIRLRPYTLKNPKPLMSIRKKLTIIEHIINSSFKNGLKNIFIIVNYLSNKISNKIENIKKYQGYVNIIKEKKQLGTIGGISLISKKKLKFPIIVINGDIVSDINLVSLINFHKSMSNNITVVLKPIEKHSNFGEISLKKYQITNIEEKVIKTSFINAGIYCLDENVYDYIRKKKSKLSMDLLIKDSINKKFKVGGYPMMEFWMDIGNKVNLDKIRNIFKKKI